MKSCSGIAVISLCQ